MTKGDKVHCISVNQMVSAIWTLFENEMVHRGQINAIFLILGIKVVWIHSTTYVQYKVTHSCIKEAASLSTMNTPPCEEKLCINLYKCEHYKEFILYINSVVRVDLVGLRLSKCFLYSATEKTELVCVWLYQGHGLCHGHFSIWAYSCYSHNVHNTVMCY